MIAGEAFKFYDVLHQFNQEIKRLSITIDLEAELSPHLSWIRFRLTL
jgi:hypothetical protein